ncbi:MAG: rhamnulokinase, partial [Bacteroidales bacterium]|nr:rhamnulokinase [Bacteroidales bacterium]
MKSTSNFLAFDLGAESGRAILGSLTDGQITLREVSRFATGMMMVHDHYRWNIYRFYEEMIKAIRQTVDLSESPLSVGMDTWGVDFALFGEDGNMLDIPYCYRDSRTDGAMEDFFKLIPTDVVYRLNGIQFMQLNSLFQLFSMVRDHSPVLKQATDLLFIPYIFHYLLTGIKKTEFSYATTSQLYNPVKGAWEKELFDAMNLPVGLMQEIVSPGTRLGSIYS